MADTIKLFDDFRHKLWKLGENNPDVIMACKDILELEPAFTAIRGKLTEEEQDQLILYMGACDAEREAYIYIAYEMGRDEGPRQPGEQRLTDSMLS